MRSLIVALATAGALLAAAPAGAATTWLCRPGLADNPCVGDLTTTVVSADGTRTVRERRSDPRARVDCFYVYPTVSRAESDNAPPVAEGAVTAVAAFQAKPFSRACRMFAPVYRQITFNGFGAARDDPSVFATAYGDVRAAWREYLRRDNRGRGVVLIGHSQGTAMLRALIRREIDRRPAVRRRLVSALLIGGNVLVRRGRDVGGDFRNVRACLRPGQVGCVIAYSTYDATPPADAAFPRAGGRLSQLIGAGGRDGIRGLQVLCTNPANLGSKRAAPLRTLSSGSGTPWAEYPGLYRARCRTQGDATWLGVTSSASDPRAGLRFPAGSPASGLHLFDVHTALGDLLLEVERQSAAYRNRPARPRR